jgi:D-alanyl-D-alanine carboxypeptidase (penicillin-binding protein 5/6)
MALISRVLGLVTGLLFVSAAAQAFETPARSAIIVDHATGMVLFAKNADEPLPPASMSKLMTLYMLFEAIRDGRVTKETEFNVSARAQAIGGSRMFVEAGKTVPVDALIHGIIVQSGNDACIVVAENLGGTEDAFAASMTRRAAEIGLTHTTLKNASGWPEPGHEMSTADIAALSRRIISEFPEFYSYFAETEFTWNGITQQNRNPLLTAGLGADGLKTGHTNEAGYGLAGSAVQDGQRIVFVASGFDSVGERSAGTEAMVNWAYGAFDKVKFFEAGAVAADVDVWLGEVPTVPMVAPGLTQMLVLREDRGGVTARVVYDAPIEAPIASGQRLGALVVEVPGQEAARFELVAGRDVARGGLTTRIGAAARLTRDRAVGLLPGRE